MLKDFENNITINNFNKLSDKTKNIIFKERRDIIDNIVKTMVNKKRYEHSKSTANLMVKLAKVHHINENDAYFAGILHDITKDFNIDEHLNYLKYYDQDKCDVKEALMHSYSAKYFIKEKLNYYNKTVLDAIYHHTDGESRSVMAMCLYIADKREPLRNLDNKLLDLAFYDLNEAFRRMKLDVKEFVKNK